MTFNWTTEYCVAMSKKYVQEIVVVVGRYWQRAYYRGCSVGVFSLSLSLSLFCWQPVEVEQWWRRQSERERERVRRQTFLSLKISLECNKRG